MVNYNSKINWDPEILTQADSLEWSSRILVEGFMQGLHRSPLRGFSSEFAEHKPYTQGDDLRFLDWRSYARTERLYIKQYDAETNLRSQIIVDATGSMGYRSDEKFLTKYHYACLMASALMRLLHRQNDSCGLSLINGDGLAEYMPPRVGRRHFERALGLMEQTAVFGEHSLGQELHPATQHLTRRSLLVIISDTWEDLEVFENGLRDLTSGHHEVHLWQLLDPQETAFLFARGEIFEDMETGFRLPINPEWMKKQYMDAFEAHQKKLKETCWAHGVTHHLLTTVQSPFRIFRDILEGREALQ